MSLSMVSLISESSRVDSDPPLDQHAEVQYPLTIFEGVRLVWVCGGGEEEGLLRIYLIGGC